MEAAERAPAFSPRMRTINTEQELRYQQEQGVPTLVLLDYDLSAAFQHNDARPSSPILDVLAEITGENDGPNWHWLALLEGGGFAYITGGCDYTGWDCQSGLEVFEAPTLEECLRLVPEAERGDFEAQLGRS